MGDQVGVRRQVAPPARAGEAGGARGGIGRDDQRHAAGREQRRDLAQRADRVVEVLEHVGEHDGAVHALGLLQRLVAHVEPERAGVLARLGGELETLDAPAAGARLVEQQPVAAADLEHPPARGVALDRVEQAPGGDAAPGLLGQVGVVAHVAVEVVELGAGGEVGLLDRPAALAGVEVGVAADAVAAGREGVRDQLRRVAPIAEAQGARADAAGHFRARLTPSRSTAVTAWISRTVPANALQVAGAGQQQRLGDRHHRQDQRERAAVQAEQELHARGS